MTDRSWMSTRAAFVGVLLSLLAACGSSTLQAQTSAQDSPSTQQSIDKNSPEYKRGRLLFIQCRACHDLQPSEIVKIGPNLAGLMGRKAAADSEFAYSPALQAAAGKLVWDKPTLDGWIEKPAAVIPGNTMAFAGISSPTDRAALLTYLEAETSTR